MRISNCSGKHGELGPAMCAHGALLQLQLAAAAASVYSSWAQVVDPIGSAAASAAARQWAQMNNTNACPGSTSKPPTSYAIPDVPTAKECEARCKGNTTCEIYAWSPNSKSCHFRLDRVWAPGYPSAGYVSGCVSSGAGAVWGCAFDPKTAPCPSHVVPPAGTPPPAPLAGCPWQVSASVGDKIGRTSEDFRMLGVNFDFWPSTKAKWGTCGVLTSNLTDPLLLALTSRLNGSLLRIGGSPADFMLYDVFEGACSPANLNKTQPADGSFQPNKRYFCPIWDQVPGQCLTMQRWDVINEFALASGLLIAFDLNGCYGREGPDTDMDFTMISGLFNRTARMAAAGASAVWGFQFTNEVYSQISPARFGKDMLALKAMLGEAWQQRAPGRPVPKLMGPDNGADDMSTAHLDGILSAGGAEAMIAATYHDYADNCADDYAATAALAGLVLNASCLDLWLAGSPDKFLNTTKTYGVELWLGEVALHASSGVNGLTNVFASSLFYAHSLGQLARSGVGMMSRQTLVNVATFTSRMFWPDISVSVVFFTSLNERTHGAHCFLAARRRLRVDQSDNWVAEPRLLCCTSLARPCGKRCAGRDHGAAVPAWIRVCPVLMLVSTLAHTYCRYCRGLCISISKSRSFGLERDNAVHPFFFLPPLAGATAPRHFECMRTWAWTGRALPS
eukprot:SAG31_NODE_1381_length_8580_cov_5.632590_1_plen_676_part_00